jgi:hypothetical protein
MNPIRMLAPALALLIAAPATAQPAPPDPAALELARLLMARDERLYDDADVGRMELQLQERLLASPGACGAENADCRNAAASVAQEFAPAFRRAERGRRELVTAYLVADRLSPDQARAALAYLRSEDGLRLFELLDTLGRPQATERRRRELDRRLARSGAPDVFPAAHARFLQRTRYLPRPAPR